MNPTVSISVPSDESRLVNQASVSFGSNKWVTAGKVITGIITAANGFFALYEHVMKWKADREKEGEDVQYVEITGLDGETIPLTELDRSWWQDHVVSFA